MPKAGRTKGHVPLTPLNLITIAVFTSWIVIAMDDYEVRSPFSDSAAASIRSIHTPNSYAANKRPIRTYLLNGEYERPWIKDKRLYRTRIGNYIIWGFLAIALALSAYYNYAETLKVHKYQVSSTVKQRNNAQ